MNWEEVPKLREVSSSLLRTLGDIESRMPSEHPYREGRKITWAHEATHGLNARLRNQLTDFRMRFFGAVCLGYLPEPVGAGWGKNACYVLDGKAFLLEEPLVTLTELAAEVPSFLRGDTFELYMVKQARYWDKQPLYILDEYSAYINGLLTGIDFAGEDGSYLDLMHVLEFMGFSFVLLYGVESGAWFQELKEKLREFIKWQAERCVKVVNTAKRFRVFQSGLILDFQKDLLVSGDFEEKRKLIAGLYGVDWLRNLFQQEDLGVL